MTNSQADEPSNDERIATLLASLASLEQERDELKALLMEKARTAEEPGVSHHLHQRVVEFHCEHREAAEQALSALRLAIRDALHADLTEFAKLAAIGMLLNAGEPPTQAEIRRGQELSQLLSSDASEGKGKG